MNEKSDEEVVITIEFEKAVQAIAWLSDLLDFMEHNNLDSAARSQLVFVKTAKEICEVFCCEHFQKELEEDEEGEQE